jgi:hypothetical protein
LYLIELPYSSTLLFINLLSLTHFNSQFIADLTFHDVRHNFAHRAREAGWSLEDVVYYLDHVIKKRTPMRVNWAGVWL